MGVFNIFSKRQKLLHGETSDVYRYDNIPSELRVQIIHLAFDVMGEPNRIDRCRDSFRQIHKILCREYGVFELTDDRDKVSQVVNYLLTVKDATRALDVVELIAKTFVCVVTTYDYQQNLKRYTLDSTHPQEGIRELNARFREHGIGYRFESEQLIRIDSQFIHKEVMKPALGLLNSKLYKGANQEFLSAHEHYRHGKHKECLNDCLKAFESVLKAICSKRKWRYDSNKDTASKLIEICLQNKLIPAYLQSQFQSMRSVLESGIPAVRNKVGAHGQGSSPVEAPQHLASYALHLTAANIVFLVEADEALQ